LSKGWAHKIPNGSTGEILITVLVILRSDGMRATIGFWTVVKKKKNENNSITPANIIIVVVVGVNVCKHKTRNGSDNNDK
jgi:hypothetical protein